MFSLPLMSKVETDQEAFEQFKLLAPKGMLKHRYFYALDASELPDELAGLDLV